MTDTPHTHDPGTIDVRAARPEDAPAFLEFAQRNRSFLEPTSPARPDSSFTIDAMRERMTSTPTRIPYLALAGELVVGQATLSNISRAAFQNATLGYSVDHRHLRRGIATAMVRYVVRDAVHAHGLHRIEAGTLLDNVASQRVLERCGFRRIGISPRHIRIAGSWQDHVLFAITAEDLDDDHR